MAKIPAPTITIQSLIDEYHQANQEPPRPHMGVSLIGHKCDRYLWLNFRWAVIEKFDGRILRLFRRGQLEEKTIVQDLRAIGLDIQNTIGQQSRVDFGCHVSGSVDGVIKYGVPEAPKTAHVVEMKTHSKKSFDDLEKNGVEKSKPLHHIQMQGYMKGLGLDRALYIAVCKDDDRIYTERVRFDKELADKAIERAKRIVQSDWMPEPMASASPDWYECKFCPAYNFCHKEQLTQEVNCRTCAHSTACANSTWTCAVWESEIPIEAQREGCDHHVLHPDLVPWQFEGGENNCAFYKIEDETLCNGVHGYASSELIANPVACATGAVDELRKEFGARIIG